MFLVAEGFEGLPLTCKHMPQVIVVSSLPHWDLLPLLVLLHKVKVFKGMCTTW
jgi:hypothetical protein